jgi:hypothetical protein
MKNNQNKYPLYLDGFLKDKHVWSDEKDLEYEDYNSNEITNIRTKVCTICGAHLRHDWVYYYACDVTTSYPASDSPCLCTGRTYAEAHGLKYKPGKVYGYTDEKPNEPINVMGLL